MKSDSESSEFIQKLSSFSIGPIVSAVIGFLTVPVTTWLISPSMFGKASMFVTFQSLISLMIFLGFDQAFVREYREEKNKNNLLFNSLFFPILFSLILITIILLERVSIANLLFSESDLFSVVILALSTPVLIFKRFGLLLIRMEERGKLYSILQISEKLIYLFLLIPLLLLWKKSYQAIILSSFGMTLVITIVELVITRKYWQFAGNVDRKLLNKMLRFGVPLIPVGVLVWIMNSMDKVSLRIWSDYSEIGLYAGAFKIVLVMDIIKRSFSNFWIPVSYRWYKEKVSVKRFETVNIHLSAVLTLLFALIVIFRNVIILLLDPSYYSSSSLVPFLLFVPVMYTLSETTVLGIAFSRKTVFNLYITIIVALINLVGNFILVPNYGALGASLATGFSYIIFFILRSVIGNRLWEGISLTRAFVNLCLIILLSAITLLRNYLYEIFMLIVIFIVNFKEYKYLFKIFLSYLKSKDN